MQWRGLVLALLVAVAHVHATVQIVGNPMPFNQSLIAGFTQPMCQYQVQGGRTDGGLTDEDFVDTSPGLCAHGNATAVRSHLVRFFAPTFDFKVELVMHVPVEPAAGNPVTQRTLNDDMAPASLANETLLYQDIAGAALLSPAMRRLLAIDANQIQLLQDTNCNVKFSDADKAAAFSAAAGIDLYGGTAGLTTGITAGAMAATGDVDDSARVACRNAISKSITDRQSEYLLSIIGTSGNPGLLGELAKGSQLSADFFQSGVAWIDAQDSFWKAQNNFTNGDLQQFMTIGTNAAKLQQQAIQNNTDFLDQVRQYSAEQSSEYDAQLTNVGLKVQAFSSGAALQKQVFTLYWKTLVSMQSLSAAEIARNLALLEQFLQQLQDLLLAIERHDQLVDERRGLTYAVHQTLALLEAAGYVPFTLDGPEGGQPPMVQGLPPPHEMTYAEASATADGAGDNFEHLTIVHTETRPVGSPSTTPTRIVADEIFFYSMPDFRLDKVPPTFSIRELAQWLGGDGQCPSAGAAGCQIWATVYRHTCAGRGFRDPNNAANVYQYTLDAVLQPGNVANPPSKNLRELLGCSGIDVITEPTTAGAPTDVAVGMQPLRSRVLFNEYLAGLCTDTGSTGPFWIESGFTGNRSRIDRDPSRCATEYRTQKAQQLQGVTLPGMAYYLLKQSFDAQRAFKSLLEKQRWGTMPLHTKVSHVPGQYTRDGRWLEVYMASVLAHRPSMVPVYKLTPIGWHHEGTVEDADTGVDARPNLRVGGDFDQPLGAGFLYVGFLECLFDDCPGGRSFYDVDPFAICTEQHPAACAKKIGYIWAPPDVQQPSGLRYTVSSPRPIVTLREWLDNSLGSSFDASMGTAGILDYFEELEPVVPGDLAFKHRVRVVNPTNKTLGRFGLALQNFGVLSNRPDAPEETTVLSLVPNIWRERTTFVVSDGTSRPPALQAGCPLQDNVKVQTGVNSLPQLVIWNVHQTGSIALDVELSGSSVANCTAGSQTNLVIAADSTVSLPLPPACPGKQRIVLWKHGASHSLPSSKCFDTTVTTRPTRPLPVVRPTLPFINSSVVKTSNAVDAAIWQLGSLATISLDVMSGTLDAATEDVQLTGLPPSFTDSNATLRSQYLMAAITSSSASSTAGFARAAGFLDVAHNATAVFAADASRLEADVAAATQAGAVLAAATVPAVNRSRELHALADEVSANADAFTNLIRAIQNRPAPPVGFTDYSESDWDTFLELANELKNLPAAAIELAEVVLEAGLNVLGLSGIWGTIVYAVVIIVSCAIPVVTIWLIHKCVSG